MCVCRLFCFLVCGRAMWVRWREVWLQVQAVTFYVGGGAAVGVTGVEDTSGKQSVVDGGQRDRCSCCDNKDENV